MGLPTVVHYRMKAGAYFEAIQQYSSHPSEPAILGCSHLPFPEGEGLMWSPRINSFVDRYERKRAAAYRAGPADFPRRERERAASARDLAMAIMDHGWAYDRGGHVYGYARIGRAIELTRRRSPAMPPESRIDRPEGRALTGEGERCSKYATAAW